MAPDDGTRLLTALWAGASGLVEARAIGPGPVRRSFLPLAEAVARLPGWRRWCDAHDRSLYFGVLPRVGRDGTKAGIAPGAVAWADLDAKDYPGGLGECRDRARRAPLAPSAVVASGAGLHLYWFADAPIPPADVERVCKGAARALGSDRSVAHRAALLRVPGSVNPKHAHRPVARVLALDNGRRYPAAVLLRTFGRHADPKPRRRPVWRPVAPATVGGALSSDPEARERVAVALGGRVRRSGTGPAVACDLPCPACGRPDVWFYVDPGERSSVARCNHRHSCAWFGPVAAVAGCVA